MLALPFKNPDKAVDWPGALDKYVRRTYSKRQAEAHSAQFASVAETRRVAVSQQPNKNTAEDIRKALVRYHRLLVALEGRFDMSQLRLTFVWRDAFKPSVKQGEADSRFERGAVLFNLAAVLSFEATVQKRSEADGIKLACQHFQLAAGLLHQLGQLVSDAPWAGEAASSGDLCFHSVDAMKTLMLAQAQRCFYEKAVLDGLSPKLLSLVASQAGTYYGLTAAMLRADRTAARVDASWATVVDWNLSLFEGLAEFHAAEVHAAAYEYGLQVARLGLGVSKLKRAVALSSRAEPALRRVYEETLGKVEWAHGLAVKDNTTVYCEPVPDAASLPAVPGKSIVKPLPFEALDNTEGGPGALCDDPFVRIVPVAIQHILDGYSVAARARIDALHARLEQIVSRGQSRLLDLDLPHALQAVESGANPRAGGADTLPTALAAALTAVHKAGGEQALRAAVTKLSQVEMSCGKAAKEVGDRLDQEQREEDKMEAEHGPRWRLVSTARAAISAARSDLSSCSAKLAAAASANAMVVERFSRLAASQAMPLLELTMDEARSCAELRAALDALTEHEASRGRLLLQCVETQRPTRRLTLEKPTANAKLGMSLVDNSVGELGVLVDALSSDGLASGCGLAAGDVLLAFNGSLCRSHQQARTLCDAAASIELVLQVSPYNQDFVSALVYRGGTPAEELVQAELGKMAPIEAQAGNYAERHAELLEQAILKNEEFVAKRISAVEGALEAKQAYLRELNQTVAQYEAFSAQVAEGTKFYASAVERLEALQSKATDLQRDRAELHGQMRAARNSPHDQPLHASPQPGLLSHAPQGAATGSPFEARGPAGPQGGGAAAPTAAARQLMEMGFSRAQAEGALAESGDDIAGGLIVLLSLARGGGGSRNGSPRGGGPSAPAGGPLVPPHPPDRVLSRSGTCTRRFDLPSSLPPKVQTLVDMGFTPEQAAAALQQTNGSLEAAAENLTTTHAATPHASPDLSSPPMPSPPTVPAPPPPPAAPVPYAGGAAVSGGRGTRTGAGGAADDGAVAELVGMGFDPATSAEALRRCAGDTAAAVQLLLDHPDGLAPPAAPPAPVPVPTAVAVCAPKAAAAAPVWGTAVLSPEVQHAGAGVPAPPPVLAPIADEADLWSLVDMGFGEAQAREALAHANGDAGVAISMLLSPHPSQGAPPPGPAAGRLPPSTVATLVDAAFIGAPQPPAASAASPRPQGGPHVVLTPVSLASSAPAASPSRFLPARLVGRGASAARASPAHAEAPMPFSAGAGGGPYGNLAGYAWEAPPVNAPPAAPPPPYQQPVHYQPPPYNYH